MRILTSLLLSLLCLAASAADWPRFRGPNGDGVSPEKGLNKDWKAKPPKELWRIKLGDGGYSGPAVAAGKLFIIDKAGKEDVVRAVDTASGKDLWSFKYKDDYDSGNPQWGNGRSTPTYDDGKVFTLGPSGMLHGLDAEKGTKLWNVDLKAEFKGRWRRETWGYTGAPIVDGNKLIVVAGGPGATVVALDKNTGKTIWKGGGDDQPGYATPVIATIEGKRQYVVFTGMSVIGVDTENGALLWRVPWETSYDVNGADPVVIGNTVFVTSGYGKGCGLVTVSGGKAELTYSNKNMKSQFNAPVHIDGFLYGISGQANSGGELVCLNPKDGSVAWKQPGFEAGGLIGVDGAVIAVSGNEGGDVVLAKANPKAFEELGRFAMPKGGKQWTPPIVADGKLYVRNQRELLCFDLK
ncbi:MAG TPA: PQQ-binding-like beta-propeller repeat protein [Planctomycetota bacterium]|nr:PQQ-binding-like beta-propeller repeat protein [Planctomycetota bacterium]